MGQGKWEHSGIQMIILHTCMEYYLMLSRQLLKDGGGLGGDDDDDSVFILSSALFETLIHKIHEVLLLSSFYR